MNFLLNGVIAPIVTPLDSMDKLNYPSLERMINHVIEGGVQAISILGNTGEENCLDYHLRSQMIIDTKYLYLFLFDPELLISQFHLIAER